MAQRSKADKQIEEDIGLNANDTGGQRMAIHACDCMAVMFYVNMVLM